MSRLRHSHASLPGGAGLALAAGAVLCALSGWTIAAAQTAATTFQSVLTPSPTVDTGNPPRFEKFKWSDAMAQAAPPRRFTPVDDSATGSTGFDSDYARRRQARAAAKKTTRNRTQALAQNNLTQSAVPPAQPSPYQAPPPPLAPPGDPANAAYAARPPGSPPPLIAPTDKPPKTRKAHTDIEDPYKPLGVRAGSFLLFPAVELRGGYNTNPSQSRDGDGARLYTVAPELTMQSNWSRHELKADLRGNYTGYDPDETPSLSRPYFNGKVDGRIDVLKTTRIDLQGRALVATEDPDSPNLQAGLKEIPIFTTFGGTAGLAHRFNRLEIAIKGDAERTQFQDSKLVDGATASNDTRNYDQYGGALRGSYELTPGVEPFIEVGADTRVHDIATDLSGYRRDSDGKTVRAGSTLELSRLLTGEFSLGYTERKYDDPRLEKISGLIGDASLVWTASALTTVKLTASSTIGETTTPGESGVLYRDAELQVDHALRRWLIGTVKFGFGFDDYVGAERNDERYSLGLGLTYKLNRNMQLKGEFRREWLRSNEPDNDYDANIFTLGMRFQF